jgi:hypothetical protein
MQIDMHYYGTYCLARAAGISREAAQTIAYAAQFVDDSKAEQKDDHRDGGTIVAVPTAHHIGSLRNLDPDDQRLIWVPFHFIPGGMGKTWTEQLVCRKDSQIARLMINNHIKQINSSYSLELVGVAAHVYADTFAHYGFSGVSSRRNRIKGDSLVVKQSHDVVEAALGKSIADWFAKWGDQGGLLSNVRSKISSFGEAYSGALGHGGVSNYPDLPFLEWEFEYEYPHLTGTSLSQRNNHTTFLECCQALHAIFASYAKEKDKIQDSNAFTEWTALKDQVSDILLRKGDKYKRSEHWLDAARNGLYGTQEDIPVYNADSWNNQHEAFTGFKNSGEGAGLPIYRFFQAASYHRDYVLRNLLPSNDIVVI